jgi:hypothetical protein
MQLFSKLNLKHVISFINRKSSCGFAARFFYTSLAYSAPRKIQVLEFQRFYEISDFQDNFRILF